MLLSIFLENVKENTTYCNNKVTVMMGRGLSTFLLKIFYYHRGKQLGH